MKIRIKFRKYGVMKFVGHLDLMRFFQKAIRRSGIAICYSEGFSPHPVMSFAAPLGVGLTSDGEYLDIEVHSSKSSQESIADLNKEMVEGIEITGYVRLDDRAKPAMSQVSAADYEAWYKEGYKCPVCAPQMQQSLAAFFKQPDSVPIVKKTKKSQKVLDLKKLVYDFQILQPQERYFHQPAFYLDVCTGSTDNIKPELVLEAFYHSMGLEYNPFALQIHRKDVYYTMPDGTRAPLSKAGQEIVIGEHHYE